MARVNSRDNSLTQHARCDQMPEVIFVKSGTVPKSNCLGQIATGRVEQFLLIASHTITPGFLPIGALSCHGNSSISTKVSPLPGS